MWLDADAKDFILSRAPFDVPHSLRKANPKKMDQVAAALWPPSGNMKSGMQHALKCLGFSLELLAHARQWGLWQAGGRLGKDGKLSDRQFEEAWEWLKREFIDKYMENPLLKATVDWKGNHYLSKDDRSRVKNSHRGAFASWFKRLTGNTHLGKAIIRFGTFSPEALHNLLGEYFAYVNSDEYTKHRERDTTARADRSKQRGKALAARRDYRYGQRLMKKITNRDKGHADLTVSQIKKLTKFKNGELDRNVWAANKAYRFGKGFENFTPTIEQVMTLNTGFDEMTHDWFGNDE